MSDEDLDDLDGILAMLDENEDEGKPGEPVRVPSSKSALLEESADDDPTALFTTGGLQLDRSVPDIVKPWMKYHTFTRVVSVEQADAIVTECIKRGFCSLDLETEGLDNRIFYNDQGKPETVDKIVGYCLSYDGEEGFYIPVRHRPDGGDGEELNVPVEGVDAAITRLCHAAIPEGTPEAIQKDPLSYQISKPPQVVIAFWNAQFDQEFLFPVTGIDWWHPESFEDGMLAAFVKYAADKRLSLKFKAKELLRDPDGNPYEMIELKELFFGKKKDIRFDKLSPDEPGVLRYAGSDAICTYKLCTIPDLVPFARGKDYSFTYKLEKQTSCTLRPMERNRVRITREAVRKELQEQTLKRTALLERIQRFAIEQRGIRGLDPNSPKQLSEFLFSPAPKGMDISPKPEKNEASQQYKTDEATLSALAAKDNAPSILKDIVEFRGVEKFISTYLTSLANNPDENDELRFSFKQTGAGTGRFSAPAGNPDHGYSGVPVHGIPGGSEIRRVFEAREGFTMIKADYAGEELRIAANVSGEPVWINEFLHGTGDLHSITARAFFGKQEVSKEERSAGKTANFALLYGGGPQSIVRATNCDDLEARRRKQAFDKSVPVFSKWLKSQHRAVKKDLGVRTAMGRWLSIPDANSEDRAIRAACERHSVNYAIQGCGADIMKIALVLLHKAFFKRGWLKGGGGDDSVRLLLTVHDEVVLEVRHDRVAEVVPVLVEYMESPWHIPRNPSWKVPLVVEPLIGFNWASGFETRRVSEDYEPTDTEVVLNGYAYSTTRKAKVNKQGEVVETPDKQEILEGNVFRVVSAPWLMGKEPGTRSGEPTTPEAPFSNIPAAPPKEPASEKKLISEKKPEPSTAVETAVRAPEEHGPSMPPPTSLGEESTHLVLRIERLNSQTVDQMVRFVLDSGDSENGAVLHVTDVLGETLVSPELGLRVDTKALVSLLREYNLICPD